MKPIFKILILAAVIVVATILVYLIFFKGGGEIVDPTSPAGNGGTTTKIAENDSPIKKISDEAVFDFWVNPDTGEIFYFTPDGRVLNAKQGPDVEISNQKVSALNLIESWLLLVTLETPSGEFSTS
jgi:hypothetical protein